MKINLHIDRLVLDGFDLSRGDQILLETAVVAELTKQLAKKPSYQLPINNTQSIQANAIQYDGSTRASELGRRVGTAVYGGITQ